MREWVRLYTASWGHRKILALSLEAKGLYWDCLSYSGSSEDEGFVPAEYVTLVTRDSVTASQQLVAALVTVGLWEPCEGGWAIHGYDQRQGAQDDLREAARIRQQRHRAKHKADVTPVTRDQCDSHGDQNVTVTREEKKREEKRREDSPRGSEAATNGTLVGIFVETCRAAGSEPTDREKGRVGKEAKRLLELGKDRDGVIWALQEAARQNKPHLLLAYVGDWERDRAKPPKPGTSEWVSAVSARLEGAW